MPVIRSVAPLICLVAALAIAPALGPAVLAADVVIVKSGDTLTGIAKRFGVTISELVEANGIADPDRIFAGQQLVIPSAAPGPTAAPATAAAPAPPAAPARIHTVAPGENLWSIARFYGVPLSALVAANGIPNPSRIRPGLQLTLPGASAPISTAPPAAVAPQAPPATRSHTVAPGENLWRIARSYGVSLSALVAANGISDPSRIRAGLVLAIPDGAPQAGAAATTPAAPQMSPWMAAMVAKRDSVRQVIAAEAAAAGVPVPFALAVAWQESGWRQEVTSSAGAVGIMQLMPGTADWIGASIVGRPVNSHDAADNVRAGVSLLAYYLQRYGGDLDLVLAAYYQGHGAVDRHGVYPVSRPYIASIKALMQLFGS